MQELIPESLLFNLGNVPPLVMTTSVPIKVSSAWSGKCPYVNHLRTSPRNLCPKKSPLTVKAGAISHPTSNWTLMILKLRSSIDLLEVAHHPSVPILRPPLNSWTRKLTV
jgi:hypothetical protein